MFLSAAEKGAPLLDEATVAAIRAKVQAQYPDWNPDRMTMDVQPGDLLFQQLLKEAAGVAAALEPHPSYRSMMERQGQATASNAGLLIAAAAAYFLLG